jgi:EmrB/QacA subfamily drug resistance transporter
MAHDAQPNPNQPPGSARAGETRALDPKRWLALAVILVAGFMDLLDATIVNVAIPSIQTNLNARYADIEWIIAAYALAFAAVLITGGRMGDIYGRKRMFIVGVVGFTVASTLCGVATTPGMLIGARFFQGMMAALMVPQILSIIHVTFPPEERGKVFGLFGAIIGSASVFGPILGGLLVQWNVAGLHWRPIFLVNIPVGVFAVIMAALVLRESKSPDAPKLDIVGMVLAIAAVLMIAYPLTEGRTLGWPAWTWVMMGAAVPLLAVFVLYERRRTARVGSPLVVLSLFKARTFDAGLSVWLLFNIGLGGFFLVWTLYMQIGLGWTPLHAGLTSVFFAFGAAPAAGISVQVLTPKYGRRVLMAGALINAAGFGLYILLAARYGTGIHSWQMMAPLIVSGAGFGFVVAPVTDLVLSDVPIRDAGSASGLFNTMQQIGQALGIALIGVIFFSALGHQAGKGVDAVSPALRTQLTAIGVPPGPAQDGILAGFSACVHERASSTDPTAIPAVCTSSPGMAQLDPAAAAKLPNILTAAGESANGNDFYRSFGLTLGYVIVILVVVFLGMFALPRKVKTVDALSAAADLQLQAQH